MKKKGAKNQPSLRISVYKKRQNRASIVFRKNNILHRLTTIDRADKVLWELNNCRNDLRRAAVIQLSNPAKRTWVLEMGLRNEEEAVLNVWEMAQSEMKLRFKWQGDAEVLHNALGH